MRKTTDYIAIHASATYARMDIGAEEIRRWHLERGFRDIGYNYVIRRDGTVEKGRNVDVVGAHVKGFNHKSLGICLVGGLAEDGTSEGNYTPEQFIALAALLKVLTQVYPRAVVQGHRDFPGVTKPCPCFDVKEWWRLQ